MGSDASEQVMALLTELAGLKEINRQYEADPTEADREAYRLRQLRIEEIGQEIKSLAEQKKTAEGASAPQGGEEEPGVNP